MIKIINTCPTSNEFQEIIDFGKKIYDANAIRQQQSESWNKNFLHTCLVAVENDDIKARLMIYNNPNLSYKHQKIITIGNYEAIDNQEVANKILNKATKIAQSLGATLLLGSMNGSTWDSYRFSTSHANPPFFLEPHHHLYYNNHFTENGFTPFANYFSSKDTTLQFDHHPSVLEREKAFLEQGVTFRNVDLANFEIELEKLYDFNALAFQTNFLYSPISKEDFLEKYRATKQVINPNFVRIAEDAAKNIVGYIFGIQDFYNKKEKSLVLKTIARHPAKKWAGMGHVIGNQIYRKAVAEGFQSVIHAFMYDEGYSTTITKNFFGERFKNYILYGKNI